MRKLKAVARTDVGMKRDHNEDYFGLDEALGVYVVCDGMGGHASGEVASRMTTDHVVAFVSDCAGKKNPTMPYAAPQANGQSEELLSNAIQHANDRVYIEGMKDSKLEGMGTTIVAMLAIGKEMIVAHVGDSRVYCYREGEGLSQVTRDHSLLNHKIDQGELTTPEQIAGFKQGNIIVRAIGLKDYVSPEVQTVDRRPGDLFLLCSDGLTDLVDDWLIENVLEANYDDLEEGAQTLIKMANDRGGKDNITVMFVRVDDDPEAAARAAVVEDEITDPGRDAFGFHDEVTQPSGVAAVSGTADDADDDEAAEDDALAASDSVEDEDYAFDYEDEDEDDEDDEDGEVFDAIAEFGVVSAGAGGPEPVSSAGESSAAAIANTDPVMPVVKGNEDATRPGMPLLLVDQELAETPIPPPVTKPPAPRGATPRRKVATVNVQSGSSSSATGRRRANPALKDTPGAPPSIIVDLDDGDDEPPSFVIDPSLIK